MVWGKQSSYQELQKEHASLVKVSNVSVVVIFMKKINCRLYRTLGKEIKKSHLNWLVTNNHISKYATYVCAECLKIAESNIENTNRENKESTFQPLQKT